MDDAINRVRSWAIRPYFASPWAFTVAVLTIWLLWPVAHVYERWVSGHAQPLVNGLSTRLDDASYWHITGLVGTSIVLAFVSRAALSRFGPQLPRKRLANDVPCPMGYVPEVILVLQLAVYIGYGFAKRDNLWRWLKPGTLWQVDVKQALEGILCVGFIVLAYASLICVDRITRYLWDLRHDTAPATERFRRQMSSALTVGLGVFPFIVLTAGYGLYVGLFATQLVDMIDGWQAPKLFGPARGASIMALLLFFAGLILYLGQIGYALVVARCRL